jgi:hypothetical protein
VLRWCKRSCSSATLICKPRGLTPHGGLQPWNACGACPSIRRGTPGLRVARVPPASGTEAGRRPASLDRRRQDTPLDRRWPNAPEPTSRAACRRSKPRRSTIPISSSPIRTVTPATRHLAPRAEPELNPAGFRRACEVALRYREVLERRLRRAALWQQLRNPRGTARRGCRSDRQLVPNPAPSSNGLLVGWRASPFTVGPDRVMRESVHGRIAWRASATSVSPLF